MVKHAFPDSLVGKNVLVTGASRGIGREMALNYCRMGANVFITARDEKKLKEVRTCVSNLSIFVFFYYELAANFYVMTSCCCFAGAL